MKVCDRCGKPLKPIVREPQEWYDIFEARSYGSPIGRRLDLCLVCQHKLAVWLREGKEGEV